MDANLKSHLYLYPRHVLVAVPRLRERPHRHPCISCAVSAGGPMRVSVDGGPARECEAAVFAPGASRCVDSQGRAVMVAHVDQDGEFALARSLCRAPHHWMHLACETLGDFPGAVEPVLRGTLDCAAGARLIASLFNRLRPAAEDGPRLDARVAEVLREVRARLPEPLRVDELASHVGLSESRLMHLFQAELGYPFRRYVLWLRLKYALYHYEEGMSFVSLAHEAGFYDQPHFNRTARACYDLLPSLLSDASTFQVVRCPDAAGAGWCPTPPQQQVRPSRSPAPG